MWVKLDDTLDDHPKFRGIDPRAGWLHVRGLIYCGRHLTDGFVTDYVAHDLVSQIDPQQSMLKEEHPLLAQLVQRGVWERVKNGYRVHDFLDYNPSRRAILAKRKQAKARRQNVQNVRQPRGPAHDVKPRTSRERRASVAERSSAIDPSRPGPARPLQIQKQEPAASFGFWGKRLAVSQEDLARWSAAYAPVSVLEELRRLEAWAAENHRDYRNVRRFVVNNLSRAHERSTQRNGPSPMAAAPPKERAWLDDVDAPEPDLTPEQLAANQARVREMVATALGKMP